MLGKLIIALMLLASVSSAETIQFGNYTTTFNMSQPHIIDKQAHAAEIKTFDGKIELLEGGKKSYDARFIGMVNEYSMRISINSRSMVPDAYFVWISIFALVLALYSPPESLYFPEFNPIFRQLTLSMCFALGSIQMKQIENNTSNYHLHSDSGDRGDHNMTCFADTLSEGKNSLYGRPYPGYPSIAHFVFVA
jgi:hypothetical protein